MLSDALCRILMRSWSHSYSQCEEFDVILVPVQFLVSVPLKVCLNMPRYIIWNCGGITWVTSKNYDDYTALLCILVVNYAEHERWVPALKMYRAIFLVILCCLLLGINTYGWRSSGVNHVLIFELDPRNHLTHSELLEVRKLPCESKLVLIAKVWIGTILKPVRWKYSNHRITVNYALLFKFQIAGLFAVIWAVSLLGFLFSNYISIPEFASPLVLFGLCVLFLLNPFRIMYYKARWWLLRILVST